MVKVRHVACGEDAPVAQRAQMAIDAQEACLRHREAARAKPGHRPRAHRRHHEPRRQHGALVELDPFGGDRDGAAARAHRHALPRECRLQPPPGAPGQRPGDVVRPLHEAHRRASVAEAERHRQGEFDAAEATAQNDDGSRGGEQPVPGVEEGWQRLHGHDVLAPRQRRRGRGRARVERDEVEVERRTLLQRDGSRVPIQPHRPVEDQSCTRPSRQPPKVDVEGAPAIMASQMPG
jgi:hypothetical protein